MCLIGGSISLRNLQTVPRAGVEGCVEDTGADEAQEIRVVKIPVAVAVVLEDRVLQREIPAAQRVHPHAAVGDVHPIDQDIGRRMPGCLLGHMIIPEKYAKIVPAASHERLRR